MSKAKRSANPPDTKGLVHSVRGTVSLGRQRASGNTRASNNMIAANASRKRK